MLEHHLNHCWLLDLDRTLASVEESMTVVESVCVRLDLDYTKIVKAKKLAENEGISFVVTDVVKLHWPEQYHNFCSSMQAIQHPGAVYTDAQKFIAKLDEKKLPFVIITYGDPVWQTMKLELGGLIGRAHTICDIPEKSELLASWHIGDGFKIPTSQGIFNAESVTLVDDKAVAFLGLPNKVTGICLDRFNKYTQSELTVRRVSSFDDVTEEL